MVYIIFHKLAAQNTAISHTFLVWKFCESAEFPGWIVSNSAQTVRFHKTSKPNYSFLCSASCRILERIEINTTWKVSVFGNFLVRISCIRTEYGPEKLRIWTLLRSEMRILDYIPAVNLRSRVSFFGKYILNRKKLRKIRNI